MYVRSNEYKYANTHVEYKYANTYVYRYMYKIDCICMLDLMNTNTRIRTLNHANTYVEYNYANTYVEYKYANTCVEYKYANLYVEYKYANTYVAYKYSNTYVYISMYLGIYTHTCTSIQTYAHLHTYTYTCLSHTPAIFGLPRVQSRYRANLCFPTKLKQICRISQFQLICV